MTTDNPNPIARLTLDADAAALTAALLALDADAGARVLLLSGDWSAVGASLRDASSDDPVAALGGPPHPHRRVGGRRLPRRGARTGAGGRHPASQGESATFRMGHVREGGIPSHGGTQRLTRAVGRGQALRLLLTGETLDADEALRTGLVHDVGVVEDAEELAAAIADAGPIAAQYVKEAIAASADLTLRDGMRLEADLSILLHSTADRAEGLRAFAEKRKPRFEGR